MPGIANRAIRKRKQQEREGGRRKSRREWQGTRGEREEECEMYSRYRRRRRGEAWGEGELQSDRVRGGKNKGEKRWHMGGEEADERR